MEPKYKQNLHALPAVTFYQTDDGPWWFDSEESEGDELYGPYPTLEDAVAAMAVWAQEPI